MTSRGFNHICRSCV